MTSAKRKILAAATSLALCAQLFVGFSVPTAHAAVSDWLKGATMVPRWNTDFGSDSFKQSLTNLHNTGANSVALVVPYYQSNTGSTDINAGWNTPTDDSLAAAIDQAHALGMSVDIKMLVDSYDGSWRAHISPGDRDTWFARYDQNLVHLAQIAQAHHVELITIGTELVSMATYAMNGDNTQRWQKMIGDMRAVYNGKLTYGANSNDNSTDPFNDEKRFIGFWSSLDYAGLSTYYGLNSDNSVSGLKSAWNYWNSNDLRGFQQSVGKPLLIAEVGYRSVSGAHYQPWNWGMGGPVDMQEQANDYEALLGYWNDYSYMGGVYLWDWSTDPNAGGSGDSGYTPQNKTAQQVMTKWFTSAPAPSGGGSGGGGSGGTPMFNSSGSANPGGPNVGSPTQLTATIKNLDGVSSGNIVDIEVYDQNSNKVFQQFFDNQSFGTGETRSISANWTPSSAGTYRMTIGVFSGGWAQVYSWNNEAVDITVGSGSQSGGSTGGSTGGTGGGGIVDVWWPTDGTHVSGVQPVKAMLEGRDVSTYQMTWQVDGGTPVTMGDSQTDYPHKEAFIDYSGWNWKGAGSTYTLTFSASANGAGLGSKSVNIYTQ